MEPARHRIESLEALRAIAALLVLSGHALDYGGQRGDFARSCAFGADLFFVLSGYIVSLSAQRSVNAVDFLRRRALRILPLYYLATLAEAGRLARHPAGLTPERLLLSLAFWPQAEGPLLAVGWTLQFEVLFYLWLALLIAIGAWPFQECAALGPALFAFLNPITLLFAGGVLLRPLPGWAVLAAGALWIAAALAGVGDIWDCSGTITGANSAMRIALWGLPALLFVGGLAGQAGRSLPGWALFLGQQSYAIYLFQHFGLMATAKLLGSASTLAECAALGAGALGFSLVVSGALASMWRKYVARIDLGLRRPARLGG